MTPPRGVRRFRSHNAHRVTDANPASQPQASRDEDLQAIQIPTRPGRRLHFVESL